MEDCSALEKKTRVKVQLHFGFEYKKRKKKHMWEIYKMRLIHLHKMEKIEWNLNNKMEI